MTHLRPQVRLAMFAALALAITAVEWSVTRSAAFARGPVPYAVLIDLFLVMPLVYVVTVLRPARRSLVGVAPALALGALLASVLLAGRPETRRLVQAAGVIAEAAVLALLLARMRGAATEVRGAGAGDFLARLHTITDPLMRALGTELAVLYYAVAGLATKAVPLARRHGEHTTFAKSGLRGLLLVLGGVAVVEGLAVHAVLAPVSLRAAWLASALNAYALVWLTGAYGAAKLRPVIVTTDRLLVRASFVWTVDVPRAAIAQVAAITEAPAGADVLRAAFGTPPCVLVTLSEPVVARGLFGRSRSVTRIAVYVDEPGELLRCLAKVRDAGAGGV